LEASWPIILSFMGLQLIEEAFQHYLKTCYPSITDEMLPFLKSGYYGGVTSCLQMLTPSLTRELISLTIGLERGIFLSTEGNIPDDLLLAKQFKEFIAMVKYPVTNIDILDHIKISFCTGIFHCNDLLDRHNFEVSIYKKILTEVQESYK
jgi:hypothetical protein